MCTLLVGYSGLKPGVLAHQYPIVCKKSVPQALGVPCIGPFLPFQNRLSSHQNVEIHAYCEITICEELLMFTVEVGKNGKKNL